MFCLCAGVCVGFYVRVEWLCLCVSVCMHMAACMVACVCVVLCFDDDDDDDDLYVSNPKIRCVSRPNCE